MGKNKKKSEAVQQLKPRGRCVFFEVDADWVKLLEVSSSKGKLEISRALLTPMDPELIIADTLKDFFSKSKTSSPSLMCSIPRQLVNVRLLELPSTEPDEIADMVQLQTARQTPYSMSEILWDYKTLGYTRQGTYTRVMLGIVQRSVVRERYYEIEDAGLEVERMTLSSEGVIQWFLAHLGNQSGDKPVMLLDVDSYYTHMVVVQHHKVVFTTCIMWGAKQAGEGSEPFIKRVKEAVRSADDALHGVSISQMVLSGAAAGATSEMAASLQSQVGIACEPVDVLAPIKWGKGLGNIAQDEAYQTVSLTSLIGMAMSPDDLFLHFVPDVFLLRRQLEERHKRWSFVACSLCAAFVAGSLYATLSAGYRARRIRMLDEQIEGYRDDVTRVERMVEVIRATRTRQDIYMLPEQLLPEVLKSVPEGVYLDELEINIESGSFALAGTAPTRRDVRDFISNLEQSNMFQTVQEGGGTAMNRDERFQFQVSGALQVGGES